MAKARIWAEIGVLQLAPYIKAKSHRKSLRI